MASIVLLVVTLSAAGEKQAPLLLPDDITIRDPFVLPVPEDKTYYLYGTGSPLGKWGFDAYASKDLKNWEGPFRVFQPPEGFWGEHSFWAPEVHHYRGKYYLFGTFARGKDRRGTQICVSDSPRGPFVPLGDGAQTPRAWMSLDGTLFRDDAHQPWMVFCHEWLQVENGEMCAMRLSEDLSTASGNPILLFRAADSPLSAKITGSERHGWVTDGPCLYRHRSGALLMLWSTFGKDGKYLILTARSATGKLEGPWTHDPEPLHQADGGHATLFRALDGTLMITFHQPNHRPERPIFRQIDETDTGLRLKP